MTEPRSAADLLAQAAGDLARAGVASARVDAELLLAHVLGLQRSRLMTVGPVSPQHAARFAEVLARRVRREPLQYIVGVAPFRHLELAVGPGVFIPRPETELLVDSVLAAVRGAGHPAVVDLCAGSGALALAIAQERPDANVVAVEVDPQALVWLRRNTEGTRVQVVAADVRDRERLRARVRALVAGPVDAVVSNPPYVPEGVAVDPEVRADPAHAVFAGPDGLALIPAVIEAAASLLRTQGGFLALEHDESHADAVLALFGPDSRWTGARVHSDLTGRPRFTTVLRTRTPA